MRAGCGLSVHDRMHSCKVYKGQQVHLLQTETFELEGLLKYTEYSVTLEAFNAKGRGPRSSPSVVARTLEDGTYYIQQNFFKKF